MHLPQPRLDVRSVVYLRDMDTTDQDTPHVTYSDLDKSFSFHKFTADGEKIPLVGDVVLEENQDEIETPKGKPLDQSQSDSEESNNLSHSGLSHVSGNPLQDPSSTLKFSPPHQVPTYESEPGVETRQMNPQFTDLMQAESPAAVSCTTSPSAKPSGKHPKSPNIIAQDNNDDSSIVSASSNISTDVLNGIPEDINT